MSAPTIPIVSRLLNVHAIVTIKLIFHSPHLACGRLNGELQKLLSGKYDGFGGQVQGESRLSVTAFSDINALLAKWVQGLVRILGDKVIGGYLSGSLAYGDFVPDRSDIDLQAVVRATCPA